MMIEGVWLYLWLGLAALAAGAVNSIAGGGTLLTFPALLSGVSPVIANGTSTVALVPGALSAAWGYRRDLGGARRWLPLLALPSVAGGVVGSLLVIRLAPGFFEGLVPWLILMATLLFVVQALLRRRVGFGGAAPRARTVAAVMVFQFLVAVYGGYFGAGIGILMLSALGLMGLGDIHAMNGLKNVLNFCINGVSVGVFVLHGAVDWHCAALMAPAGILGAYAGSCFAQRLDRRLIRRIVIAIGFVLTACFFYQRWSGG
jgi:uncharacterized membrane protein YfcA